LDFIVNLTPTRQGHDVIFVCVDKLTKIVHFIPTTTFVIRKEMIQLSRVHVLKIHGVPLKIISDRWKIHWKVLARVAPSFGH